MKQHPLHQLLTYQDFDALRDGLHSLGRFQVENKQLAADSRQTKADKSPYCDIDGVSNTRLRILLQGLSKTYPIVSEEQSLAENRAAIQSPGPVWAIDPLEGTQTYLDGKPNYAISVGLLSAPDADGHRKPVFGMIYLPEERGLYYTRLDGTARFEFLVPERGDGHVRPVMPGRQIGALHTMPANKKISIVTGYRDEAKQCFQGDYTIDDQKDVGVRRVLHVAHGNARGKAHASSMGHNSRIWDTAAAEAIADMAGAGLYPTDNTRGAITDHHLYYGADPQHYLNGELFLNPPYIAAHRGLIAQLVPKSDVPLPPAQDVGVSGP